jgi:hypothetical protein
MAITTLAALFDELVSAATPASVRSLLGELGDFADVDVDETFGSLGLRWHPFNDSLSNISNIGLGTKPGRSMTERLTNAMDAVLETRATPGGKNPESCRLAAKQWLGRPVSGPDDGLYRWEFAGKEYDRLINVVLRGSGIEDAPTVDVLDRGIGLRPEQFPDTILSLIRGNKLTKKYLIGAFGQGGAATLAFADYSLVMSRHKDDPARIGFTVIRVLRLSNQYKEDAFAYLALSGPDGRPTVPEVKREGIVALYEANDNVKHMPAFETGTLVRHLGYKLHGLTGSLSPTPGNLYHYLHVSMFDPLLPFRVIDLREPAKARDELVTGNRNRLMRLVQKRDDEKEGRVEMRHYRPMEYIAPYGSEDATVGIEYWVPLAYKKPAKGKGGEQQLRPASNELFVMPGHPIIGSLNGQNQGELTTRLLRDVGLGMVSKHIVVHIDASDASSQVRRELFSTNREGFKDGDVLKELSRVLQRILDEDEELDVIEKELTDRLTKRETEATSQEVVDQITKLLLDAGLKVLKEGTTVAPGQGEKHPLPEKRRRKYQQKDPLPTLPFPQVTKWAIVSPKPKMLIRQNDDEVVLVETDADAEFDRQKRLSIRFEPEKSLELAGKAPLRGGRIRWRVRPASSLVAGAMGSATVTITRPDGTQMSDTVPYEVLPPRDERTKKEKGLVPPFRVVPVSPEQTEVWAAAWPHLSDEASDEALHSVAYVPVSAGDETIVYYSTVFEPYQAQIDRLKTESPSLAQLFETSYAVWIGYHAILQHQAPDPKDVEESEFKLLEEEERTRVARMQIKQALQVAKMRQQLMKTQEEPV